MRCNQISRIQILLPILMFLQFHPLTAEEESRELVCIDLKGVPLCGASSYLKEGEDWSKYHMKNLFDGTKDTAWVEGAEGDGIGEEVWFEIEPGLKELVLVNGYAKNQNLFLRNNRVKKLELRIWVGVQEPGKITELGPVFKAVPASSPWFFELKDTSEVQSIPISIAWDRVEQKMESLLASVQAMDRASYFLILTIRGVYKGTHYPDTCLADIAWKLDPNYSGPEGLGKLDIRGSWTVEKGSPWESIQIEWMPPSYQQWSSYLHGRLFDAGTWNLGKGEFAVWSNAKNGEEFVFTRARKENEKLFLQAQDGTLHVWQKEGP
ncbi:MAG: hypothetical protein N2442_09060 [Spirochaetes bacterium]|nr:hypothetical protein [Spirochaetota bacterium]